MIRVIRLVEVLSGACLRVPTSSQLQVAEREKKVTSVKKVWFVVKVGR